MTATATTTDNALHCFEKAGLGKASFRYVGMVDQDMAYGERVLNRSLNITTKPGGTCAYCSTYIVNMFNVESADGQKFHVGCECIKKTGDAGLIRKVEADVKKMESAKRAAKKTAKTLADKEYCETTLRDAREALANKPHPNAYFAKDGKTLADWCDWMAENGNWSTLAVALRREVAA